MVYGLDVIDVDAHAKGLRAHEDTAGATFEGLFDGLLVFLVHSTVIEKNLRSVTAPSLRDRNDLSAIGAIDDGVLVGCYRLVDPGIGELHLDALDGSRKLGLATPLYVKPNVLPARIAQEELAVTKLEVTDCLIHYVIPPAIDGRCR